MLRKIIDWLSRRRRESYIGGHFADLLDPRFQSLVREYGGPGYLLFFQEDLNKKRARWRIFNSETNKTAFFEIRRSLFDDDQFNTMDTVVLDAIEEVKD